MPNHDFLGVVFDLDGTLLDTAPDLHAAANRMLDKLGQPAMTLEQVKSFIGNGVPKLVQRCLTAAGLRYCDAQYDQALADFHRFYSKDLATLTRPYPGVMELLKALQIRNIQMAVCTNKPEKPAHELCRTMQISQFMDPIIGGDTLPVKKPDAAPLNHTIQTMNLTNGDTLYVGDSETDYLTAEAAGVKFAYFKGGYQSGPIADFEPDWAMNDMGDVMGIVSE